MRIMISNDDGIFAPGIDALVKAFGAAGHEVIVCAPDSQRSAASHSLSIGRPISVKKVEFDGAAEAYAISGTPADCVKLGMTVLRKDCDAVISGINHGYNAGTDILYSGTVAAAMEGAICGVPALAVSQPFCREDYTQAAALAVKVFDRMMAEKLEPYTIWNLNHPACDCPKGLVMAKMQPLHYNETYYKQEDNEDGCETYVLRGVVDETRQQSDDYVKLGEGYATLTVLHGNLMDMAGQKAMEEKL